MTSAGKYAALLQKDELAFFDLAALTRQPDASFEELRRLYQRDDRVRVPPTVFNALLNRPESAPIPAA